MPFQLNSPYVGKPAYVQQEPCNQEPWWLLEKPITVINKLIKINITCG